MKQREVHGDTPRGGKSTPEYNAWKGMNARCHNPNNPDYPRYGGRGIRVHHEWRESYLKFLAYVGRKPSPKHSLDRYPDQNGNYEPNNVRWATQREQTNNMRSNRPLTINGETRTLTEWSEAAGIKLTTLFHRLKRGWPETDLLRPALRPPFTRIGAHERSRYGSYK